MRRSGYIFTGLYAGGKGVRQHASKSVCESCVLLYVNGRACKGVRVRERDFVSEGM
jgi:hypothetical protein